jgi:hypothetical protein
MGVNTMQKQAHLMLQRQEFDARKKKSRKRSSNCTTQQQQKCTPETHERALKAAISFARTHVLIIIYARM